MTAADDPDLPGPIPPLPPHEPARFPGEHLLRRRAPMPYACSETSHPGGLRVRRGPFSAVALRGNAPAGALWLDPDGLWRGAPGAAAALAVSGEPDEEMLEGLEERAPSFRRFAEAREWLLGLLSGSGDVVPFRSRRPGPRRR